MSIPYQQAIFTPEPLPAAHAMSLLDALGVPVHCRVFEPTLASARARAENINPSRYARTRNALNGDVTGLSPYLTHGIVSLDWVARTVAATHPLGYADKLVFELGWRAFFHHVWASAAEPDAILADMRAAYLWGGTYAPTLPADIAEGRTGVRAIDAAVRQLYATGYLHNHARMWIASYCVHVRKVHWRAGADWLLSHLLDGDLASNHLSWQWVAATFSSKPYLFNASNVEKFAPDSARESWHSSHSVIDQSYEALDALARLNGDSGAEAGTHVGVEEPAVYSAKQLLDLAAFKRLGQIDAAQSALRSMALNTSADVALELVHPWALSERGALSAGTPKPPLRIGIVHTPAHTHWPWSFLRWQFVLARMEAICDVVFIGDAAALAQCAHWPVSTRVAAQSTLFEGYRDVLPTLATLHAAPALFALPGAPCTSFSKFYERVQRAEPDFSKLLI